MDSKIRGHVKYWADKQGHGKVMSEDGREVFIHFKFFVARAQGTRITVHEGQWLRFNVVQDAKGPRAADIEIL